MSINLTIAYFINMIGGVEFRPFHHPDISLPVISRYVGDELLQLAASYLEACVTRGRSWTWGESFPDRNRFRCANYRLRKKGLIARRRSAGGSYTLEMTPTAEERMPVAFRPERRWKRKWRGIWYLLTYDVPEVDRGYRSELRHFLTRMRMGCLQKSVWVTPFDIRPDYHDLVHGAGLASYAFLFESHTVLMQDPADIVSTAWDFGRIGDIQDIYCEVYADNLERLLNGEPTRLELQSLARDELASYLAAMEEDPLLPAALLPSGYSGRDTFYLHKKFIRAVGARL